MKKFIAYSLLSFAFVFSFSPLLAGAVTTTVKVKPTVVTANISVTNYAFSPSVINAHVGDTIKITLTDKEGKHSFALSAFKVNVPINAGQTRTFSFKVTKRGTFAFRCGVPCGPGHRNMTGVVIVS